MLSAFCFLQVLSVAVSIQFEFAAPILCDFLSLLLLLTGFDTLCQTLINSNFNHPLPYSTSMHASPRTALSFCRLLVWNLLSAPRFEPTWAAQKLAQTSLNQNLNGSLTHTPSIQSKPSLNLSEATCSLYWICPTPWYQATSFKTVYKLQNTLKLSMTVFCQCFLPFSSQFCHLCDCILWQSLNVKVTVHLSSSMLSTVSPLVRLLWSTCFSRTIKFYRKTGSWIGSMHLKSTLSGIAW